MASLCNDGGGKRRVTFRGWDNRRRTLYLRNVSDHTAEAHRRNLELLIEAGPRGALDPAVLRWRDGLNDRLRGKLIQFGLIEPPATTTAGGDDGAAAAAARAAATTVATLVSEWMAVQHVKPNTRRNYEQASGYLTRFLTSERDVRLVTPADAAKYRAWLCAQECLTRPGKDGRRKPSGRKLARATVSKWIVIARQIFTFAVDELELLGGNPFRKLKAGSQSNRKRQRFVPWPDFERLIDVLPDAQWRLMVALSRVGMLRCPSEVLAMRWRDVDFGDGRETGSMTVWSSKTEHREGGECRTVPLFPELRPYLDDALVLAERPAPDDFVITRYRGTRTNLRTQLLRYVRKAKLTAWPRPWHNMRSSRITELVAAGESIYDVCRWAGNSSRVAEGHYLQPTDAAFARATSLSTAARVAQNAAQQGAAGRRVEPPDPALRPAAAGCDDLQGVRRSPQEANAPSPRAEITTGAANFDDDLAQIAARLELKHYVALVRASPRLARSAKKALVAGIRAAWLARPRQRRSGGPGARA